MTHERGQFCSGLSHIAILLCAALAILSGAVFVFLVPGMPSRLLSLGTTPVSIKPAQSISFSGQNSTGTGSVISVSPSVPIPSSVSLLARAFDAMHAPPGDGVAFDANPPDPSVSPFVLFSSSNVTADLAEPSPAVLEQPMRIVLISEISVADASSVQHEFVELYNPNNSTIDLAGWELRKKTQSGSDSVLVSSKKFSGIIPANSYFLIAHPEYAPSIGADLAWSGSGYSISANGTVYLVDGQGRTVDLVGYGECFAYEAAAAQNPSAQASVARLTQTNTDNNLTDFVLAIASPRSAAAGPGFVVPTRFVPSPTPSISIMSTPAQQSAVPTPTAMLSPMPSPMPTVPSEPSPTSVPPPTSTSEPSPVPTPVLVHPIIVQVQFGIEGNANADFVQMQNTGTDALDLTDYKLVKKTASSGTEYSLKSWKNDQQSIPAAAQFWWVNSGYTDKVTELQSQGITVFVTSATIAPANGIALKYQDQVVSSVQW